MNHLKIRPPAAPAAVDILRKKTAALRAAWRANARKWTFTWPEHPAPRTYAHAAGFLSGSNIILPGLISLLYGLCLHLMGARFVRLHFREDRIMAVFENPRDILDRLDEELRRAPALAPALFARVLADACSRIATLRPTGKTVRLDRLIGVGAWSDAACALVELELPAWTVRRLVREDGEWLCSLSRQPHVPVAFDDPVDAWHAQLPLAILRAFVAARRRSSIVTEIAAPVPRLRPMPDVIVCCDNFA